MKDQLELLHDQLWHWLDDRATEGYSSLELAAIMSTAGLSLYRTSLNDNDYNLMVDSISESRYQIKKLNLPTIN